MQKIKFLEGVRAFEQVEGGYSGAQKLYFEKEGRKYFLKIGKFEVRNDLEQLFCAAEIPHPKVVDFGKYDEENSYIIEEFAEGTPFKFKLDQYEAEFVYEFGFKVGQGYRNLRKKFPDKKVDDKTYEKFMQEVDYRLEKLNLSIKENQQKLSTLQIEFLKFVYKYLNEKRALVKNSVMVFGNTDIKPSNFLVDGRNITVIDFEHTDYKELSLSLLWSFCRADFKDDKNYAFANGYLDGLFNFDVPKGFLKCCNYTYLFNICKYCYLYINQGEFDKLEQLIVYIKAFHIKHGRLTIDKDLLQVATMKDFKMLDMFEINLMQGSYSPFNLTFKCVKGKERYFLKIMKTRKRQFDHCVKLYQLMQNKNIPISPVRFYGNCGKKRVFMVYDFVDFPEMDKSAKDVSFKEGAKLGQMAAKQLKKLKGCKVEGMKTFDQCELYKTLIQDMDFVFENNETNGLINFNKKDYKSFIDKYIKSFDNEKIDLIYGDVKFGNILFDGKDKIVFVDNESLMYSYDIVNFYYNFYSAFYGSKPSLYQGFMNGYLKYMNGGKIPKRIDGQFKLLLVARFLRDVKAIKNSVGSAKNIESLNKMCQRYLVEGEAIEWLR